MLCSFSPQSMKRLANAADFSDVEVRRDMFAGGHDETGQCVRMQR